MWPLRPRDVNQFGEMVTWATDGNFRPSVEDFDFDSSDDNRQWFLLKREYTSGMAEYTWQPMEFFVERGHLIQLIKYFEKIIKRFKITTGEQTFLEDLPQFHRVIYDSDRYNSNRFDDDNAEAKPDHMCFVELPKQVLGYKIPPESHKRLNYYVKWDDDDLEVLPAREMEGALGDVANFFISMSYENCFPTQPKEEKKYGGAYNYRQKMGISKASEQSYKYPQYFRTTVDNNWTIQHTLERSPECSFCKRGEPTEQRRRRFAWLGKDLLREAWEPPCNCSGSVADRSC